MDRILLVTWYTYINIYIYICNILGCPPRLSPFPFYTGFFVSKCNFRRKLRKSSRKFVRPNVPPPPAPPCFRNVVIVFTSSLGIGILIFRMLKTGMQIIAYFVIFSFNSHHYTRNFLPSSTKFQFFVSYILIPPTRQKSCQYFPFFVHHYPRSNR